MVKCSFHKNTKTYSFCKNEVIKNNLFCTGIEKNKKKVSQTLGISKSYSKKILKTTSNMKIKCEDYFIPRNILFQRIVAGLHKILREKKESSQLSQIPKALPIILSRGRDPQ